MPTYWKEKEESLSIEFLTCDDKRRNEIAIILYPKLKRMVESILFKYISFTKSDDYIQELILDTIAEVYLQLPKFDTTKNKRVFGFLGFVIKNHLIDTLKASKKKFDLFEDLELQERLKLFQIEYTNGEENYQEALKRILSHLETLKTKINAAYPQDKNKSTKVERLRKKRMLEIIRLTQEYLLKFECYDMRNILDYCYNNSQELQVLSIKSVGYHYFPMVFNQAVNPKETGLVDARYTSTKQVIDLDFTPDISASQKSYRRVKNNTQYKFY
jgi:hypothetical protein